MTQISSSHFWHYTSIQILNITDSYRKQKHQEKFHRYLTAVQIKRLIRYKYLYNSNTLHIISINQPTPSAKVRKHREMYCTAVTADAVYLTVSTNMENVVVQNLPSSPFHASTLPQSGHDTNCFSQIQHLKIQNRTLCILLELIMQLCEDGINVT